MVVRTAQQPWTIPAFLEVAAARAPEKPFLVAPDGTLSYAQAVALSQRAASGFRRLGVRAGDRVAAMLPNSTAFVLAWFGLARLGAVLLPINTAYTQAEVRSLLEHAEPRLALASARFFEVLRPAWSGPLASLEPGVGADASWAELLAEPPLLDPPAASEEDVAVLLYTSGSTGRSKGVLQSHRTYVLTGQAFPWWLGLTSADRLLTPLPLFHINAQAYSTMGAIGAGATLVLLERFSASRFWEQVRASGATEANLLGALLAILLKQPPTPAEREHALRTIYTAPALPPALHRTVEARFGARLMVGYAMSECTFGTITPREGPFPLGSMGRPRHHPDPTIENAVRLVREDGQEAAPGEVGEIAMRGPAVMRGYFRDPEATRQTLRDGWLFSGDLATRDADDCYTFVDRKKDLIRRRGENVSSVEVEQVLLEHPNVREAAVVPVPSELTEEEVKAYVVPQPGAQLTPDEVRAWCAERLAAFKVPSLVELCADLPRTPTGKIAKHVLRGRREVG
ncbi:MAG: AMP-binding protein [Chloroflexi bacterium]|nr:AMP-binding protein [Chloroflexota bacterium]